jgi:hypothetical protein
MCIFRLAPGKAIKNLISKLEKSYLPEKLKIKYKRLTTPAAR